MLIISFSVFVLAGDAGRDMPENMPEKLPMPNTKLSNDARLGEYIQVATLMGSLTQTSWSGDCFQNNTGWLAEHLESSTMSIMIETNNEENWSCTETYEFMVGSEIMASGNFNVSETNPHEIMFNPTPEQMREIRENGVAVYQQRQSEIKDKKSGHNLLKEVVEMII
ncbi:uncharacterized protein LOC126686862 [Mercurialis annua]|uniref:uncharacterized protein LOC126686862 n=1 Tax=Mercurialis annua TaxID=3986 RepID=UPI00216034EE|nr:uncharacterized protein LOC126686862 [Mercurialis annua]